MFPRTAIQPPHEGLKTMKNEISHSAGGTVFAGPKAMNVFSAITIAHALKLYAETKMQVNRAYTPTAMLKAASSMTGKTFKRGQYMEAYKALMQLAEKEKAEVAAEMAQE